MTKEEIIAAAQPYLDQMATVQDAQAISFCVIGQRKLWRSYRDNYPEKLQGLTFEQFIDEGAPIRLMLELDNQYAYSVVEKALERLQHG